jgi:Pyruvate/2-oxoacid:ferredoxin oxidoreductase gamma subunit
MVSLDALVKAIEERFPPAVARGNIGAARAAYEEVHAHA